MPSIRRTTIFTNLLVFLVVGVVQPPVLEPWTVQVQEFHANILEAPRINWDFQEFRQTFKEDFRKGFLNSTGKKPAVGLQEEAAAVTWNLRFQGMEAVKAANLRLAEKYKARGTLYLEY